MKDWIKAIISVGFMLLCGFLYVYIYVYKPTVESQIPPSVNAPKKILFIGDSGTPLLTDSIGKMANWGSGWTCADLKKSLDTTHQDTSIDIVVMSIGTNDLYSPKVDVEALMASLHKTYPNATLLVVTGSYGWSVWTQKVDPIEYMLFYNRFGCKVIPGFGYSKYHPNTESSKDVRQRIKLSLSK